MRTTTDINFYDLLGVSPTATRDQIRKAYRRLAHKYHPDHNNGDPRTEEHFKLIVEAYETLSDPIRRETYNHTYGPFHDTNHDNNAATDNGTAHNVGVGEGDVASRMLRVLEDSWAAIRRHHPEIPPVVIIIASGTDGKKTKWGHHAPGRWNVIGQNRTEIMISGEGLQRGPAAVLGTLLHEATHALAAARGIKDTSRQGRYHNQKFAHLGAELGIDVACDERIGWSITTVPDQTRDRYQAQINALKNAMTLWRLSETTTPTTPRRNSNLIPAICACGRTIRIAKTTLEGAPSGAAHVTPTSNPNRSKGQSRDHP